MGSAHSLKQPVIHFDFRMRAAINEDDEDCYHRSMNGDIALVRLRNHREEETTIGYVEVWFIDGTRAIDDGKDIVEICDSIEQQLYEYVHSVYVDGAIDHGICGAPRSQDVLVLHRIEIGKKYRGKGYGLLVARKLVEYFGYQCGVIVLRPSPLQFSPISRHAGWQEKYDTSRYPESRREATRKLTAYWKKLGLKPTRDKAILCIPQEQRLVDNETPRMCPFNAPKGIPRDASVKGGRIHQEGWVGTFRPKTPVKTS